MYHPNRVECLPCVLWRQSGSDPNLRHLHPLKDSRHVGSDAVPLSQHAFYDSISFSLTSDDCVCKPCYMDFQRKHNKENRCIPRWAKVKNDFYSTRLNKHCVYCCGDDCSCGNIHYWGPDQWNGGDTSITTWKKFLSLTGHVDHTIPDHATHICKVHCRKVYAERISRSCSVCSSHESSIWNLICDVASTPEHIERSFQIEFGTVHFFGWICNSCTLCYRNDDQLETQLAHDTESSDSMTSHKSQLLLNIKYS